VAQTQGFAALRPGLSNLAPLGLSLATSALLFDSSTSLASSYRAYLSCGTSARIREIRGHLFFESSWLRLAAALRDSG